MLRIHVGNLSEGATEALLLERFGEYGQVDVVNVICDPATGVSRGFAFVEMSHNEEAERAIAALDGAELAGQAMALGESRPRGAKGGAAASFEA